MRNNHRTTWAPRLLALLWACLFAAQCAPSRKGAASPKSLIEFLTYLDGRVPDALPETVSSVSRDLRNYELNRDAARSLARFGDAALPDLEGALDSLSMHGYRSDKTRNSGWLLLSYARIRGPAALPRLRALASDPALGFLAPSCDRSIALALGLTSYVSASRPPHRNVMPDENRAFCRTRPDEPRDALDTFILGWEHGDEAFLESALGEGAKAALRALLRAESWQSLRAKLARGKVADTAVGYRLNVPGLLGQPEESLVEEGPPSRATHSLFLPNGQVITTFTDRYGSDCGSYTLSFSWEPVRIFDRLSNTYLVDNQDIGELIALVAVCASRGQSQ